MSCKTLTIGVLILHVNVQGIKASWKNYCNMYMSLYFNNALATLINKCTKSTHHHNHIMYSLRMDARSCFPRATAASYGVYPSQYLSVPPIFILRSAFDSINKYTISVMSCSFRSIIPVPGTQRLHRGCNLWKETYLSQDSLPPAQRYHGNSLHCARDSSHGLCQWYSKLQETGSRRVPGATGPPFTHNL